MPLSLHRRPSRFFGLPKFLPDRHSVLAPRMFRLGLEQLYSAHPSRLWSFSNRTSGQFFPYQFLALIKQLHRPRVTDRIKYSHLGSIQMQPP